MTTAQPVYNKYVIILSLSAQKRFQKAGERAEGGEAGVARTGE